MTSLGLRSPQFSEEVAWLPCWLQHLKQDGYNESLKESQIPLKQSVKDLLLSQHNGGDDEDTNALSWEEGRYNSCHLFLSGEDSSPVNIFPSPGNVLQFSLHFSPDAGSLFCQMQSLDAFHNLVASSSKLLSMQQADASVDFRKNMRSAVDPGACEQNLLSASFPEIANKDVSKSPTNTIYSVRQRKEKSKGVVFQTADINNAIELSVAASEALAIHNLIKMDAVSATLPTETILEVAHCVKQARLVGLEDGYHYSNEESNNGDSLSDLDDFTMTDAYEDVGLHHSVSSEKHFCNSALSQAKDVSAAGNDNGCNNKHIPDILSQHINIDNNSLQKQLDINLDMEMQLKADLPLGSLSCERLKHFNDIVVGSNTHTPFKSDPPIFHQLKQSDLDVVSIDQTVGLVMVDMPTGKLQNSFNSSEKENWETHLVQDRFRSRWLGGWTVKESDSKLNQTNSKQIPKYFIRETSILSESADVAPDVGSSVQKDDAKCEIGSQSSVRFAGTCNKPDEGILHVQDMVACSNPSLADPLCSVVPCSISSEDADCNTQSDIEYDKEKFASAIPEFKVDNFLRTSDQNAAFNSRDDQITPLQDGVDIPTCTSEMLNQADEKLACVQQTVRKQLSSLKTFSMIVPNRSLSPFLYKRSSVGHSAWNWVAGNKNEKNHEYFINHKTIADITHARSNDINVAGGCDIPVEPSQERSPLVLNHRTRVRMLGPKTAVNDSNVEKPLKQHALTETTVQHQQNNNLPNIQGECKKLLDGEVRVTKQVRFSESAEQLHRKRTFLKLESSYQTRSSVRAKRRKSFKSFPNSSPHMKQSLTNYCNSVGMKLIFHSIEFMLTGLSHPKERDMEALIRKSGGVVLPDIPSPPTARTQRKSKLSRLQLPIILCMTKLQTAKFLYGCAVGASIVNVDWLTDCIAAGTILEPEKYMILPNRNDMKWTRIGKPVGQVNQKGIFERVGIMLHGKHSFCIKLAKIVKHGGGKVFKSLQWLIRSIHEDRISVGAIVAEDTIRVSRHLNHCALEEKIPVMSSSWIIRSLYSGELLPFTEESHASPVLIEVLHSADLSQEI